MKRMTAIPFLALVMGLLDMLIKCQHRIEYQTKMLIFGKLFNDDVIKKYWKIGWFITFAREYHLS